MLCQLVAGAKSPRGVLLDRLEPGSKEAEFRLAVFPPWASRARVMSEVVLAVAVTRVLAELLLVTLSTAVRAGSEVFTKGVDDLLG